MATTNVRWAVIQHLLGALRAADGMVGVQVSAGWPGEDVKPDTIWIDSVEGQVQIPVMQGGRKQRDDKFDIPFEFRVVDRKDLDATMQRLTVLVAALEDILADDPGLADEDGVIDAEITDERLTCAQTRDGALGFAQVTVSVHSRLL